jgi:hypothetical protein
MVTFVVQPDKSFRSIFGERQAQYLLLGIQLFQVPCLML